MKRLAALALLGAVVAVDRAVWRHLQGGVRTIGRVNLRRVDGLLRRAEPRGERPFADPLLSQFGGLTVLESPLVPEGKLVMLPHGVLASTATLRGSLVLWEPG